MIYLRRDHKPLRFKNLFLQSKQIAPHSLGLYIHIPFCSMVCHYCDFAKTANWNSSLVEAYMLKILDDCKQWLDELSKLQNGFTVKTLNFGGGTPSLLSREYTDIISLLKQFLAPDCEISLEANPKDCTEETLDIWRTLGFNRISLGVQTLDPNGLNFLKRDHNVEQALKAIGIASKKFKNINVDLIYSWPSQTNEQWLYDLEKVCSYEVTHLSLYNLCYARKTPIGRAHARGKIKEPSDTQQAGMYELASDFLARKGFNHDEVSNWSKPGFHCRHNEIYWQDGYYLGLGAGAHGYLPMHSDAGIRYEYPRSERAIVRRKSKPAQMTAQDKTKSSELAERFGISIESRNLDMWLDELITTGLRTSKGLNLERAQKMTGKYFDPSLDPQVSYAYSNGLLRLDPDKHLKLDSSEWFREQAWSLLVSYCFSQRN